MRTIKTAIKPITFGNDKGMFYVVADWHGWYNQRGDFNGVTQYLHTDGTWHASPRHEMTDEWTGHFPTKEAAETLLASVGPPTKDAPRSTLKCKECHHIYSPREQHVCPDEEYIRRRDELIAAVASDVFNSESGENW